MVHIKYEAGILNSFGDIRIQKTLTKTFNICVTGADAYADADADTNRRLSTILVPSKIGQSLPFLYIPLDNLYKAIWWILRKSIEAYESYWTTKWKI